MSEAPKLYVNKPKKAQVKQFQQQSKGMEGQSSSAPSTTTASSSKPPEVPRESFARRYKFLWPLLLTVNLAVGAYLFMRTKKKDVTVEDEPTGAASAASSASATPPAVTESPTAALPIIAQPLTAVGPVPAEQQRELFKWMLEEKRKIKTKDPEEKKKIDEEKAILKQFIRAKSIPSI